MRESIVASTEPSTTSVSQSVISTPLSLMFGPTLSLASPSTTGTAWLAAGAVGAEAARAAPLGVLGRTSSRLPLLLKKGDCRAITYLVLGVLKSLGCYGRACLH